MKGDKEMGKKKKKKVLHGQNKLIIIWLSKKCYLELVIKYCW